MFEKDLPEQGGVFFCGLPARTERYVRAGRSPPAGRQEGASRGNSDRREYASAAEVFKHALSMIWLRIAIFVVSVVGGLYVSAWIPAAGILLLSLRWRAFEALALGLGMDFFWLPVGHVPLFTLGAILVVWIMEPIRREFLT